jgi:hypothetical protein
MVERGRRARLSLNRQAAEEEDMDVDGAVSLLEEILGPFGPRDGVAAGDLDEGERRLGIVLPSSLRTLYVRTGGNTALHQSHDHLVAPRDWEIDGGRLVFYRENQSICAWGVAVGAGAAPEPLVEIAYADGPGAGAWAPAFDRVPDFFAVQGAWQAVHGGLPVTALVTGAIVAGIAPPDDARGARVKAAATRHARERIVTRASSVWMLDGCVLVYDDAHFFGLGGRDEASFLAASRVLGMRLEDWDYASLRDGTADLD